MGVVRSVGFNWSRGVWFIALTSGAIECCLDIQTHLSRTLSGGYSRDQAKTLGDKNPSQIKNKHGVETSIEVTFMISSMRGTGF